MGEGEEREEERKEESERRSGKKRKRGRRMSYSLTTMSSEEGVEVAVPELDV